MEMIILRCLFVTQMKISDRYVYKFRALKTSPGWRYSWGSYLSINDTKDKYITSPGDSLKKEKRVKHWVLGLQCVVGK